MRIAGQMSKLLAVIVVSGLLLHALQVPHQHVGGVTDGHALHVHAADASVPAKPAIEQSSFHAFSEEKLLLLLLMVLAGALLLSGLPSTALIRTLQSCSLSTPTTCRLRYSYLLWLFATGVLHPKLH